MDKTLKILIVGSDPKLSGEFESALASIPNWRALIHYASDYPQALETVANRSPHLVCLEIGRDVRELTALTREIQQQSPETALAGLYSPERLGHESTDELIIQVVRANVRDFLRRPISSTELRDLLDRLFATRTPKRTA